MSCRCGARMGEPLFNEVTVLEKMIRAIETAEAVAAGMLRHQPRNLAIDAAREGLRRERDEVLKALAAVAGADAPFVAERRAGGHSKAVALAVFDAAREEALNPPPPMTPERRARIAKEIAEIEAQEAAAAEAAKVAEVARREEERLAKKREAARLTNEKRRVKKLAELSGSSR